MDVQVTVVRNGTEKVISCREGESLLEALQTQHIYLSAACGGKGRCGKCGVLMLQGATEAGDADRQFFDEAELARGMRLACAAYPKEDCRVVIETGDEADFEIVTEYRRASTESLASTEEQGGNRKWCSEVSERQTMPDVGGVSDGTNGDWYEIGIDIGTTTVAVSLIACDSGKICHTVTVINHQRMYGADVISRIQAANDGKLSELSHSIRKDLYDSILRLWKETEDAQRVGMEERAAEGAVCGAGTRRIRRIAIAGNTTMEHLLMGYSCETLGVYPFTPVNISTISTDVGELFGAIRNGEDCLEDTIPVTLLPGISTYVGADIAAGMLSCGFDHSDKVNILIDLGTNGEMAIGNRERILVTSTAAGPAFEGGNISCGMGSVQGAISQVEINGTDVSCRTIGGKAPLGLCGTGVIETTYELLKEEWIDETGMLDEDYFDDGFPLAKTPDGEEISFIQKDVREIQLAKSAVRAGLETLLLRYGVTYDEIGTLYLAGGFGFRLNLEKAIGIGLLPEELADRMCAVGNSSLGGTVEYLTGSDAAGRLDQILAVSEEVPLASDRDFNQFYTDYMFFE